MIKSIARYFARPLAVVAVLAAAGIGYSALGQLPPGVSDPNAQDCSKLLTQEAIDACNTRGVGGGNALTVGGLGYYYNIPDGKHIDPSDPSPTDNSGNPVDTQVDSSNNVIWVQDCGHCSINIVEQMLAQGGNTTEVQDALHPLASASKQDPPPPQCADPGKCLVRNSDGGTNGCSDTCGGCDDGKGTLPECWQWDELADGCTMKDNCRSPNDLPDPYPVVEARQPDSWVWTGGCGDGSFGGMVHDSWYSDLYPSITGCYTPEERFSKVVGVQPPLNIIPIRVPDDDRLNLHERCIPGDAVLDTGSGSSSGTSGGSGSTAIAVSDDEFGTQEPASTIQCLANDYIDDFSNFCRQYTMQEDRYLKDQWKWSADTNCWEMIENMPAFSAPVAGEHYLPLALYLNDEAFPDGQAYNARYGNMGQHGYGRYRIYDPHANPKGVWDANQAKYVEGPRALNPADVYNYGDPQFIINTWKDENYVGRKTKLQACLKQYIEEYAHLGDCGAIVLPGAKPYISDSYCQWVVMARQDQNKTFLQTLGALPPIQSALSTILGTVMQSISTAVGGGPVSPPQFTSSRRGLRSEYFDYQNFATAGWIPASPPIGGLPPEQSSDICTKAISDGHLSPIRSSQVFNSHKSLDFTRRGCPSVIGPDTWPTFFNMNTCDFSRGTQQFSEGFRCLEFGAPDANGDRACILKDPDSLFYYQAFPPQVIPRNPLLTSSLHGAGTQAWWLGVRKGLTGTIDDITSGNVGGLVDLAKGIKPVAANTLPPTPYGIPIQPPQDWVDPLWVASTCTHHEEFAPLDVPPFVDYWNETSDWLPNFLIDARSLIPGMDALMPAVAGMQTCIYPRHNEPQEKVCCKDAGVFGCGDDSDYTENSCSDCNILQSCNKRVVDHMVGQDFRDGNCLDPWMPLDTVMGFPFYAGDVPEMFRAYQWPNAMQLVGDLLTIVVSTASQSLGSYVSDLTNAAPAWVGTVIGYTKTAIKTMQTVQKAVDTTQTVVKVASLANTALPMLGVYKKDSFFGKTITWTGGVAQVGINDWNTVAGPVEKLVAALQPDALLNAAGLGGLDIGCLGQEWEKMYPGEGTGDTQLNQYQQGAQDNASADANQTPRSPYPDGKGNNKKIPAKCLKHTNKANLPTVYSWHPNIMRFQDAQWCEFEVPYLPHIYHADYLNVDMGTLGKALADEVTAMASLANLGANPKYLTAAYSAALSSTSPQMLPGALDLAEGTPGNVDYDPTSDAAKIFSKLRAVYDDDDADYGQDSAHYDMRKEPGLQMVERIRDGCGAFTQRAAWVHDMNGSGLALWLINTAQGRCQNWKGIYGKQYNEPKALSWRLPRFDYEFLKAFIECTGPVYSNGPNVCGGGINWLQITLNAMPCWNLPDKCPSNTVCFGAVCPPIPGNGRPTNLDDKTEYSEPWNLMGGGKKFGFWCNCPKDNLLTTTCNESMCTCRANNINLVPYPAIPLYTATSPDTGKIALLSINFCDGYGPFAQWLQCYYQARAKSCPVLTREVSNGIVGSMHLQTNPTNMRTATGAFHALSKQPDAAVMPDQICEGIEPKVSYENLRWNAEEPNILAHLPIMAEFGARDQTPFYNEARTVDHDIGFLKHRDFVFQSAVHDIEEPYLEITLPWPTSMNTHSSSVSLFSDVVYNDDVKVNDMQTFQKAHDAANMAWLETRLSDLGGADDTGHVHADYPRAQASEAILGPRGCDIGGWYEMMLYQARCIRWFKLNCLCDYRKTFIEGSAESYVLMRGGASFNTKAASVRNTMLQITQGRMLWPMMWRGFAGPDYAPPPAKIVDYDVAGCAGDPAAEEDANPDAVLDTTEADPNLRKKIDKWELNCAGKLWKQPIKDDGTSAYAGLSLAKPGDFMLYDEEIKVGQGPQAGEDARYPRHVAYIDEVTLDKYGEPIIIMVSEMNWGKNQDSCGNTDRWGLVTTRRIYRDQQDVVEGQLCSNPDYADCYEPNWWNIKLYRPTLDVYNQDRPICFSATDRATHTYLGQYMDDEYALHIPEKFLPDSRGMDVQVGSDGNVVVDDSGDPLPVPDAITEDMDADAIVATGAWKRNHYGWYDANEVVAFLKQRRGFCDPPPVIERCYSTEENGGDNAEPDCREEGTFAPDYTIPDKFQ